MPEIKSNSIGRYLKRKKVVLREAAVRTSVYLSVCLCPSVCRSVYLSAECSFVHDNVRKNASILFFFGQTVLENARCMSVQINIVLFSAAPRAKYIHIIQGVTEMHGKMLTTSYWLHVELGKNNWHTFYKI
jgi:hypothetical protein